MIMHTQKLREAARSIFKAGVESVMPDRLIANTVILQDNELHISGAVHRLRPDQKIHVFGSGKASVGMAKSLLPILQDRIAGGVVITNQRTEDNLAPLRMMEGSHPVPDHKSIESAESVIDGLSSLSSNDFFIYLLSGGSSALIEKPLQSISLGEMQETTRLLLHTNVPIQQVNAVRKHLSRVKGGRLAQSTRAAGAVLVISDVIGDDLSVIGSGPLYYDATSYGQCRQILEQASIWDKVPAGVRAVITQGVNGEIPETPKQQLSTIKHYLLGTNRVALEGAQSQAKKLGMSCHIMSSTLAGEAREAAKVLVSLAGNIRTYHEPFKPPVCLLFGGETTVTVRGKGKGGRNQELALAALAEIGSRDKILLLSGGTDGIDGNSPAAGALADKGLFAEAARLGLAIDSFLYDNNSNTFFHAVGGLLQTGSTGTNVMDIILLIIDREDL